MIKEALELLVEQAQKASGASDKVQVISLPGESPNRFAVVHPDGYMERFEAAPKPIDSQLCSVAEVVQHVDHIWRRYKALPVVYYNRKSVVIIHNEGPDSDRLARTEIPLEKTEAYVKLAEFAKSIQSIQQRDFVRLLRVTLWDCLGDDGKQLLKTARAIDFTTYSKTGGRVEHTRESLGREIKSELVPIEGTIPETITLNVRVYKDPVMQTQHRVTCAVEISTDTQRFALTPLPGEIERITEEQLEILRGIITAKIEPTKDGKPVSYAAPVFYGHP